MSCYMFRLNYHLQGANTYIANTYIANTYIAKTAIKSSYNAFFSPGATTHCGFVFCSPLSGYNLLAYEVS
jgi:hypothetical protein